VLTTRESALDAPQLATLRESDLQQFERTEDVQMYEEQEASAAAEAAVIRNKKRRHETKKPKKVPLIVLPPLFSHS
tara:strand:+ start:140 stop:367 length:228 start_codon:yes stop_codon:yes gene_type:complete